MDPGALVGPGSGATPLFRLHQVSRLRLVVAVPEALVGGIVKGARVPFTVPAYPGETFYGVISLAAHDLDPKTRTMPVELEVKNADLRLARGHVLRSLLAGATPAGLAARASDQRRDDDRTDVRDPGEGRRGRMGERRSRRSRR